MSQRRHRTVLVSGFTLVELLVVMSLMSLIMLAMGGALRGMGQTEQRMDQRLARMDEFRVAVSFIQTALGNVSARKSDALPASGKPSVLFEGAEQSVSWVGVMPARDGAGGRYFFKLSVEPLTGDTTAIGTEDQGVVIRFLPFVTGSAVDWSLAEQRVLVERVQGMTLAYEDRREAPFVWSSVWPVEDRLPYTVKLQIRTAHGEWPPLFVPLRAMPFGAGSGGVAVFGGAAQ